MFLKSDVYFRPFANEKDNGYALAGVAQWIECQPGNRRFAGVIPGQAHAWAVGQVLSWGHARGNQLMYLTH